MNALGTFWTLTVTLGQFLAECTVLASVGESEHTPNFLFLHV